MSDVNYGETHSSVTAFRTCPRMGFYRYRAGGYGIRQNETSKALVIGSAYHRGMQFVGQNWEKFQGTFRKGSLQPPRFGAGPDKIDWEPKVRKVIDAYAEFAGQDLDLEELEICVEHAVGLVLCHIAKLQADMSDIIFNKVEESFQGVIGARPFSGQVDGIVTVGGQKLLLEHKTKSRIPANLMDLLAVDGQLLRYFYFMSGDKPEGVLYTSAKKSMIRQKKETKKAAAETHEEFLERLRLDYEEKGIRAVEHTQVLIDSEDVRECLRGTAHTIDMISHYDKSGKYPKYEHSCDGKYGPCDFFHVCNVLKWDGKGEPPEGFTCKIGKHEELQQEEGTEV